MQCGDRATGAQTIYAGSASTCTCQRSEASSGSNRQTVPVRMERVERVRDARRVDTDRGDGAAQRLLHRSARAFVGVGERA